MKPYSRSDRVGGHIQRHLAELMQRSIHDPRLDPATITSVDVSPDLRMARIYFTVTGPKAARQKAKQGFERAKGFIKRELAHRLGLRYMPELKFYVDESFDTGGRIEDIFHRLNREDGSDHTPTEG